MQHIARHQEMFLFQRRWERGIGNGLSQPQSAAAEPQLNPISRGEHYHNLSWLILSWIGFWRAKELKWIKIKRNLDSYIGGVTCSPHGPQTQDSPSHFYGRSPS